jgi:hypothetical protein
VITIPAFALPPTIKDSPVAYETRCIVHDATRAARMKDPVKRACSWPAGSAQYALWFATYTEALNHG